MQDLQSRTLLVENKRSMQSCCKRIVNIKSSEVALAVAKNIINCNHSMLQPVVAGVSINWLAPGATGKQSQGSVEITLAADGRKAGTNKKVRVPDFGLTCNKLSGISTCCPQDANGIADSQGGACQRAGQ